jgi:hypothetical protein
MDSINAHYANTLMRAASSPHAASTGAQSAVGLVPLLAVLLTTAFSFIAVSGKSAAVILQ